MKNARKKPGQPNAARLALLFMGTLLFISASVFAEGQRDQATSLIHDGTPEAVGLSSERLARVDSLMQGYVDRGDIAGAVVMVGRKGEIAYLESFGMADIEAGTQMQSDILFRLQSMTKPIISLAMMVLYEEGEFLLSDPVSNFIPEFAEMQVLVPKGDSYSLVPAEKPITIRHLMTHTSGITYRFFGYPYITDLYKQAGVQDGVTSLVEGTIGDTVKRLAALPLRTQPGKVFGYGLSYDVLGYLIEVISDMPLDKFLTTRIFEPLGMTDTYFYLPEDQVSKLASAYLSNPAGELVAWGEEVHELGNLIMSASYPYGDTRGYFAGGMGLNGTITDYGRFLQLLLNGGELDGVRFISRKTVELMTSNQIEGLYIDTGRVWDGDKYGLGFGIRTERGEFTEIESLGSYGRGGMMSTHFWVDPSEEMFGIMMAQQFPWDYLPIRRKFRITVNQAIVD
jgi:CubicO group peptidase (beta-lactamase class C family)